MRTAKFIQSSRNQWNNTQNLPSSDSLCVYMGKNLSYLLEKTKNRRPNAALSSSLQIMNKTLRITTETGKRSVLRSFWTGPSCTHANEPVKNLNVTCTHKHCFSQAWKWVWDLSIPCRAWKRWYIEGSLKGIEIHQGSMSHPQKWWLQYLPASSRVHHIPQWLAKPTILYDYMNNSQNLN